MGCRLWGRKVRSRVLNWRVAARRKVAGPADLWTTYGTFPVLSSIWRCFERLQLPACFGKHGERRAESVETLVYQHQLLIRCAPKPIQIGLRLVRKSQIWGPGNLKPTTLIVLASSHEHRNDKA